MIISYRKAPKMIILAPVYEDCSAALRLCAELVLNLGDQFLLVIVEDGSIERRLSGQQLGQFGVEAHLVVLKANMGHQQAIAIGLSYIEENLNLEVPVVVMDSDGEDKPSSISSLVDAVQDEDVDIAVAQRSQRSERVSFRVFYSLYKLLFVLLSGKRIDFGNFMAISPFALRRLVTMQAPWMHLASSTLISKLRIKKVQTARGERYAGFSKMNFTSLSLHGFKAMMVFAENVLVRVATTCAVIAVLSLASMSLAICLKLFGFATPGWFSLALGLLFLVFLQTGTLTLLTLMLSGSVNKALPPRKAYLGYVESLEIVNKIEV